MTRCCRRVILGPNTGIVIKSQPQPKVIVHGELLVQWVTCKHLSILHGIGLSSINFEQELRKKITHELFYAPSIKYGKFLLYPIIYFNSSSHNLLMKQANFSLSTISKDTLLQRTKRKQCKGFYSVFGAFSLHLQRTCLERCPFIQQSKINSNLGKKVSKHKHC